MTTGNSTTIHTFTVQNTGTRDCMDITRGRANNRLFVFIVVLVTSKVQQLIRRNHRRQQWSFQTRNRSSCWFWQAGSGHSSIIPSSFRDGQQNVDFTRSTWCYICTMYC